MNQYNLYQEILRDLREDYELKQSEVAQLIGTTQQQYSKYEKGESEVPVRALVALATHYGLSTDYMLGRTKEKKDGAAKLSKEINEIIHSLEEVRQRETELLSKLTSLTKLQAEE